jgi:hypothetical protein
LDAVAHSKPVAAGFQLIPADDESPESLADHLNCLKSGSNFQPGIRTLDATRFGEQEMITYINTQRTWMIVHGVAGGSEVRQAVSRVNIQTVLNRIQCPIMLVPETAPLRRPERLVYLADLRYSQIPVINYLTKLRAGNESVILTHVCAKGLPEIDKTYAYDLFNSGLSKYVACQNLYFTQLQEKQFSNIIDTVLHGMQGDMLVCCNHSYHFEQLLGSTASSNIRGYITVPVLAFPY